MEAIALQRGHRSARLRRRRWHHAASHTLRFSGARYCGRLRSGADALLRVHGDDAVEQHMVRDPDRAAVAGVDDGGSALDRAYRAGDLADRDGLAGLVGGPDVAAGADRAGDVTAAETEGEREGGADRGQAHP